MKRHAVVVAILLVLGSLLLLRHHADRRGTLAAVAPEIGLAFPEAEAFRVGRDILRQGGRGASRSVEANRGEVLLKIEIESGLSEAQALQAMTERLALIQSLYTNIPFPYPGMVSNTVGVAATVQPELLEIAIGKAAVPVYVLASNARHTYGAMAEEMVAYRGGLCFLYNPAGRTLYRLDYFLPRQEYSREALVAFFAGIGPVSGTVTYPGADGSPEQRSPAAAAPTAEEQAAAAGSGPACKDCNLILIALEPLGANHVGCYGYGRNTTPNLDAFARDGFRFDNAVSAASWSLPAFMSWFTSLYPSQHKVTNKYSTYTEEQQVLANLAELSPGVATLAQVLREHGYRTAGFTGDASLSRDFGFALGFEEYFDEQRFGGFDLTMPKAVDWLAKHRDEKVFLFVQGYDVHGQYPVAREHLAQFLDTPYQGGLQGSEEEYWALRDRNIEEGGIAVSEDDMRLWRAVYDAKIFAADRRIGAFLATLRETGLLERSIVIISSGSGNEYGEHGRIDHGFSLYQELVHVPLLIRIPGRQGRVPDLVRTIDLMPTALDLLDVPVSPGVQRQMRGVSLVPAMAGARLDLAAIAETDYLQQAFKRAILTNDGWKLIVSLDTEERELYNLKDDPGEKNNLIGAEGRVAYELEHRLFSELGSERNSR